MKNSDCCPHLHKQIAVWLKALIILDAKTALHALLRQVYLMVTGCGVNAVVHEACAPHAHEPLILKEDMISVEHLSALCSDLVLRLDNKERAIVTRGQAYFHALLVEVRCRARDQCEKTL